MKLEKRLMNSGQTSASIGSQTLNYEKRTVDVIFATDTPVVRRDYAIGQYNEVLDMKGANLTRLNSGNAPVLDSHNNTSIENVIGVIETATIQNNQGHATLRFSNSPKGDLALNMVRDGTLKSVSVGYELQKMEERSGSKDVIPTFLVTRWAPFEISMVGVPADKNSVIRSENKNQTECEIVLKKEKNMSSVKTERERVKYINNMVRSGNLDQTEADELIDNEISQEEVGKRILARIAEKRPEPIQQSMKVEMGRTQDDARRVCLSDSILHRMDPVNFKMTEAGKQLFGRSLSQSFEFVVPRHSMESEYQYVQRAMSTSDLPLLLASSGTKSMQQAYQLAPKSHSLWTKSSTLKNYKEASQIGISDFSTLLERKEGGEFKHSYISEKSEVAQLKDFGRIIAFSNQLIVNDDLNALQKLSNGAGLAASRLDNVLAYSALTTNKTMSDGVELYHASHGNLGTAAAISDTTITEAFKKMLAQTSVGANDKLNLMPKYLIVGPDKLAEAKRQLAEINATATADVNIWSGQLQLVCDSEISGKQFYFAANPSEMDTVTLFRLEGMESPTFESKFDFNTNSLLLKVAYPVTAAPMDWRGLVKNAGN